MSQQRRRRTLITIVTRITAGANFMIILLAIFLFLPSITSAFHDGGVARCSGCHVLHVTIDGLPIDPGSPFGNEMILKYESVSELCLSCHATSNGAVFSTDPLLPSNEIGAGNFTFLLEDNLNDAANGSFNPIAGHRAGHNIISPSNGLTVDPVNSTSPGGSYPSAEMTCASCHDPHGNDNFRLLRGNGSVDPSGFMFMTEAPTAEGISLYYSEETPTNHTAYQSGWSEWCGNCHGEYHDEGDYSNFEHPSDESLDSDEGDNYNAYDGPDNMTGGDYSTAYLPDVPLENVSNTINSTTGATKSSRIACITCHRSHASSAVASMRWDSSVRYLIHDGAESGSYAIPDPYSSLTQRPLCVKCHNEEETRHGSDRGCTYCH